MSSDANEDGDVAGLRLRSLAGVAVALAVPVVVVWWPGCRQYPTATSPEAMVLIKMLYTACNTRDPSRLERVERGVELAAREGKLSPAERQAFEGIIAGARRGDWESARRASLRFAEDQVGRGFPRADDEDDERASRPTGKPPAGR